MQPLHKQLSDLNDKLGGSISRLEGDRVLQCHNDKGMGRVVSVGLEAGISYTEYDLNLAEKLKVELDNNTGSALYFIYCLEGNLQYSWADSPDKKEEIQELQTVILGSNETYVNLYVPEGQKTSFALIKVNHTNSEMKNTVDGLALNQKLFYQFLTRSKAEPFEYHGTFNLKIKEQLMQIRAIKQTGVVRKLLIKGIIHFALALELMHHQRDMSQKEGIQSRLTKSELIRVQEAIDSIAKKPEYHYTIAYLSKQSGLSAAKLQEGFKVLECCTVANYIKRQRVELAEKLIKEGDLNISEVVYTIGFTSRSYFSKIFKKRYKCTPKFYQERCRNLAESV